MPLASGTISGSWRSGWRRRSWQTVEPRRSWSRSSRLHSSCRSRRRRRQTPRLSATCAQHSTEHRSVISKGSVLQMWSQNMLRALIIDNCLCFWQIVKILTLYTPVIEFEERVSTTFIATIQVSSCKVLPRSSSSFVFIETSAAETVEFVSPHVFVFKIYFRTFWKTELSHLLWWWTPRRSSPLPSPSRPPLLPWRPSRSLLALVWASSHASRPVPSEFALPE